MIESPASLIYFSPMSVYELAVAARRGRLEIPGDPADWISKSARQLGLHATRLSPEVASAAALLELTHGDPIDRILIATAMKLAVPILSRDSELIRQKLVPVICD